MKAAALVQGLSLVILVIIFQVLVSRVDTKKEVKRRWQHALTGHALVQVSYFLPKDVCINLLLIGAAAIAFLKFFQFDKYRKLFGELLRSDELDGSRLPGAFFFLLGTAMCALQFPMPTARYAVECLSIADPMASWVGSSVKSPKFHASASVAGCLACFVTALLMGLAYLPQNASLKQRLCGAIACALAECMSFGYDNMVIPIATAAAIDNIF